VVRRQDGFTLVELMVTLVIVTFVLVAASQMFASLLTQFKQQGKMAETNMESAVGLEILRRDIKSSGYGLPWAIGNAVYYEAPTASDAGSFNDATTGVPRAIVANNPSFATANDSDYLVIKSASVARNDVSRKWTTLSHDNARRTWTPASENMDNNDRVIVLSPGLTNTISLVSAGGTFWTKFNNPANSSTYGSTYGFKPPDKSETRIIYGIDPDTDPRMPFNRADYYVSTSQRPSRCAANTGVFVKAVLDQADGDFDLDSDGSPDEMPLMDCVADMQVDFWLDTDGDGDINWPPRDDISGLSAEEIRDEVKEVRVYLLAHEGQRDPNYDFSKGGTRESLSVTESLGGNSRTVSFANLKTAIGNPEYKYYRWKIYSIEEKPGNLR
jgi:prepilin-type N-terminal cleavage/methylation domain-containing protein